MDHHDMGNYDRLKSVSLVAGLLTDPALHANTHWIELLIHHLLSDSKGDMVPTTATINYWLNEYPPIAEMYYAEDPVEDAFISRVPAAWGNCRI